MSILRARVHVQSILFSLVFVFWPLPFCLSRDTITRGNPISDLANETLVSANGRFELGFFTPNGSSDSRRYVGIWYNGNYPLTVVWVANRDNPLLNNTGLFGLATDGNLAVWTSSNQHIWSSEVKPGVSSNRTIRLMGTGNLVLSEVGESQFLWESFDNPTDTFMQGMIWRDNFNLTSWNALDDPKPGNFTFQAEATGNQYSIRQRDALIPHWKSGVYSKLRGADDKNIRMIWCLLRNLSCALPNDAAEGIRLVMDWTGKIQFYGLDDASASWTLYWYQPADVCSINNYCGNYGSCNTENSVPCKCLPGFEPTKPDSWKSGKFSDGCKRKSTSCNISNFMSFKKLIAGSPDPIPAESQEKCEQICRDNCLCEAYYYPVTYSRSLGKSTICWTWSSGLSNILELNQPNDVFDLNIRMAFTDIDPIKRSCQYCGTNVVPYPLRTNESCGDPSYFRFRCDDETSQLYFTTSNISYRVIGITPEVKKFVISLDDNTVSCSSKDLLSETLQLDHSLQFHLIGGCNSSTNEVEIGWSAPLAPECTSNSDCVDWPGTTCNATGDGMKKCHCNANPEWDPSIPICVPEEQFMQPRRPSLDKKPFYLIALAAIAILILIVGLFYYKRRTKNENGEGIQENPAFHLYDSEQRIKELISSNQFHEEDKTGIDVPFFDLEVILAATNNFSKENKLGQGGFGPVYKGTFPGGQEIAIKRLSSASGQGLEEFKNEVVLIAKLQHRNLVRLLGYCIKGEEKILLYEYMPNGSLDSFIFDSTRCLLLSWELRFEIILGIARGLLYLHQDSRLRIIHRDMKSSNVLLDEEMNPKISDFGLARIFESKQTEATTKRVIGTYGYMSPEYALDGFFSFKSDVFSYGVVVLEIISGKRNTAFYQSIGKLNLVSHAWKFWSENNALDLMDLAFREACNTSEVLKCINLALLCVQEDPIDRPTMSNVLFMLASESASLPAPKKPGFAVDRGLSTTSSSSKPETIYEISTTVVQGR